MKRISVRALLTATVILAATFTPSSGADPQAPVPLSPSAAANRALAEALTRNDAACTTPAPTTAKGYAALWATLPQHQWGGADVSLSVPLGDGRVVWLYGDTLSTYAFRHSTAIVQNKGCLHVSNLGRQVLPNGAPGAFTTNKDATTIQWIDTARPLGLSSLMITGRGITITGKGVWDFKDAGWSQQWVADVDPDGNLTNLRPHGPAQTGPAPDPGPMLTVGPERGHFGYARRTHPWATLTSGRTLVTTCQNWDDGKTHPVRDYAPIWSEQ